MNYDFCIHKLDKKICQICIDELKYHEEHHKVLVFNDVNDYDGVYTCSHCLDLFYKKEALNHETHSDDNKTELCVLCHSDDWCEHQRHYEEIFDIFGDNDCIMYYLSCRFCKYLAHKNSQCLPFACDYCCDNYKSHFVVGCDSFGIVTTQNILKNFFVGKQMSDNLRNKYIMKFRTVFSDKSIFIQCSEENGNSDCYICHEIYHNSKNVHNDCCFCQHAIKKQMAMQQAMTEIQEKRRTSEIQSNTI